MAKFNRIPKSHAPPPPRQGDSLASRKREYEEYVRSINAGEVGKLTPDKDETVRALRSRVSRAAKRLDRPVRAWSDNGAVYVEPLG